VICAKLPLPIVEGVRIRMAIKVVPYEPEHESAVAAFNQRMLEGNTGWGWYEIARDQWLPERENKRTWREHYLAIDDEGQVRGAYAHKPHEWQIRGERVLVADWQGPVSEGLLSPRYATLGLRLIREMLKRYPVLYSWGHGGHEAAMLQMIVKLGWLIHETPFCLKVLHPFRFLRGNAYLRGSRGNRIALDALAFSGLGWLGLKLLHGVLGLRGRRDRSVRVEVVDAFGPWADAVWERARNDYQALGVRDGATMNDLVPRDGRWPRGIRLRVRRGETDLGWAVVLDNQLEDDPRFGNLRVGCVADCLARPEDADAVIDAATRFLRARGVDMIGSNQSHPAWIRAFARAGYVILENRRCFAVSPAFQEALSPFETVSAGLHLTNMDGHGPSGF